MGPVIGTGGPAIPGEGAPVTVLHVDDDPDLAAEYLERERDRTAGRST